MRYSRGPGKGGSCSGSEERNRGRNGVERRPSCVVGLMGVYTLCLHAQPVWSTFSTIFPSAVNTCDIGRRRCTSRRCRPRARRVCVGSRRPSADVPTCRPRRSREGTRTRETCWNLVPRPPRTGVLPREPPKTRTCAGRCVTTASRRPPRPLPPSGAWRWRYRSETTGCTPSTGRPEGARAVPPGGAVFGFSNS